MDHNRAVKHVMRIPVSKTKWVQLWLLARLIGYVLDASLHVYAKCVVRIIGAALDYSLADVVRISGGKRRSVQLWAEAGAIRAFSRTDRRGTGTHRRFSRDEVIIACCLNGLARRQVGIGELIRIGRGLRKFLNSGDSRREVESAASFKGHGNPASSSFGRKTGIPTF